MLAAESEVLSDGRKVLVGSLTGPPLHPGRGGDVERASVAEEHGLVGGVTQKGVLEPVLRAVREA